MTYLTSYLPFGPSGQAQTGSSPPEAQCNPALPPAGSHLIVSDTLNSPAHFVLFHLVLAANAAKRRVVWVDFRSEGRTSWEVALKKLGTTLPPSFTHISPAPKSSISPNEPCLYDDAGLPTLAGVASAIKATMTDSPLILLDGLSELIWMGFSPVMVYDFIRDILSTCREHEIRKATYRHSCISYSVYPPGINLIVKTGSSLISTIHADGLPLNPLSSPEPTPPVPNMDAPDIDLLFRLIRLAGGGWWRVSNLASGRSGDVHGEITAFPLIGDDGTPRKDFPSIPQSQPLQYRLEANTVKVFPKGTGRGFL